MITDILYVTYAKDTDWFRQSIKVVQRNLSGYRRIHVVYPEQDAHQIVGAVVGTGVEFHPIPDWKGQGYHWQQWVKLNADKYSDADFIVHIDSDVFVDRPTNIEEYFVGGKPAWLWAFYTDLGLEVPWKVPTIRATGLRCEREFMAGFPFIINRSTYPRVRQWMKDHTGIDHEEYIRIAADRGSTSFSEFNVMGAVAYEAQHELYWWVDRNRQDWPKGFHSTRQFWSRRPVSDHQEAIDQMMQTEDTT